VNGSPIEQMIDAIDNLDVEAATALVAPDVRFLTVDGRRAEGVDAVHDLLTDFLSTLSSTSHHITGQWHQDDVWIAEVEATYDLRDGLRTEPLPRAFVLYEGPDGIADIRVYGAHERPLSDHAGSEEGIRVGERWIPPL